MVRIVVERMLDTQLVKICRSGEVHQCDDTKFYISLTVHLVTNSC